MDAVTILRVLWRRWPALVLGILVAAGVALAVPRPPPARHGVASVRLMLDTQQSEVVYAEAPDAVNLPWRARQLASLLAAESARLRISQGADVPYAELTVTDPALDAPTAAAPLPVRASELAAAASRFTVAVRAQAQTPIVSVDARAPDRETAARMVHETARELLRATGPTHAGERRRFVIDALGPARSRLVVDDPGALRPIGAGLGLFGLWCAVVVLLPAVRPRRRARPLARQLSASGEHASGLLGADRR
jgi:hypothetical protein